MPSSGWSSSCEESNTTFAIQLLQWDMHDTVNMNYSNSEMEADCYCPLELRVLISIEDESEGSLSSLDLFQP